jgi:Domain of unknown function (DUF4082)/Bacterial Ig-like domain
MVMRGPSMRTHTARQIVIAGLLGLAALLSVTAPRADAQSACPCSIFASSAVPAVADENDPQAVELGVKFQSDLAGFITGIRFYKGPLNTGTHTGSMWTSAGTLLARTTFTNETASGWQQVSFATPIAISANTVYVASYFAPVGQYSANLGFFTSAGVDNPPLHAIANTVSRNGVYRYGTTSGFPNSTYQSTNYWVDVVFSTNSSDTTPPTITAVSPANAATGVAVGANTTATFSEDMAPTTITTSTFELRDQNNALIPAAVSYNATSRVATLNPTANLAAGMTYTATVHGGPAGVKDVALNPLAVDRVWFYKTSGTDTTPPAVSGFTPANGATGVSTTTTVIVTFTEAMTATTINGTTIQVRRQPDGLQIPATVAYVAATKQATISFTSALATGTTYTARVLSGASGVKDLAGLAMTADAVSSFTTGGADTTPPVVTSVTPAAGATGVSGTTTVTVTFNESMSAPTITTTSFTLTAPNNTAVTASVSYNDTTRTATLTPSTQLSTGTTYTASVLGGSGGVTDVAGNALATTFTWSFTTVAASTCPCTIWAASTTPAAPAAADSSSVELGVKFRSDSDGFINGIRFYKGPGNNGTHVGNLWSTSGQLLASVTFSGETASGWQQANFASSVPISANTVYVASYHAPVGSYSADGGYFAASGTDRPPLHALGNAQSPNGVYVYGAGSFPTQTYNATNYWVDVVFDTTPILDTTPPTVVGVSPPNGVGGLSPSTIVKVTFSEAMDTTTIGTSTIELRRSDNTLVSATVSFDSASRTATLQPASQLPASSLYTLTVHGGSTDPRVKDLAGNALASNFASSFSTATATPPPPLGQGPGGPLLLITSAQNKFTTYYTEILSAEGLNFFAVADLSTVTATTLAAYDLVILGQMPLTADQVTMFTNWVNGGGNLIAMRPDKQLSVLLGLADAGSTLADAYLGINTSAAPGAGLVSDTIQFHGTADNYTLAGATAVATLYSSATAATSNPAVSLRTVGAGQVAAFAYDLAKSVIYTRQGNPAWAGQERDGTAPIRPDDMFFGISPQPNWIDFNKVAIPQADEQQRLLANLILVMNGTRKPLPRFWYLPRMAKAAVVMTGDDHANGGTVARFNEFLGASPAGCVVDNWECPRYTSYIYVPLPNMNDSLASFFNSSGFEIALHVNTGCADFTPSSLASFYSDQLASFHTNYPSLPAPTTNRTHCVVWSDWASEPKVELANNIGLDTTYYYWPGSWLTDRPGMFTGSGMPMRFADIDGSLIDVYQATSQMTDESNQTYPFTIDTLLNNALGPQAYYGVFTANMHTDANTSAGADAILASATSRNVPIVTSRQMLAWVDGRNNSAFQNLTWDGTNLGFSIGIGLGANGLQAMLPIQFGGRTLTTLTLNGASVSFTQQLLKGVQWAIFPAAPGTYSATYATP